MNNEKNLTIYDKSDVYKREVKPLIDNIKKVCVVNNIPIFISCAISNSEEKTEYKTDGIMTGSAGINLKNDKLEDFLMVLRGAKLESFGALKKFESDEMDYIMDIEDDIEDIEKALAKETDNSNATFVGEIDQ